MLHGKILVEGLAIGVASVISCQKLPLCLMEPMPASSRMDPPLAKPFSSGGSTSGITELKRNGGECTGAVAAREERSKNMWEKEP